MNPIFPPERNTDAMNIFLSSVGVLADFQLFDENFKQLVQNSRVPPSIYINLISVSVTVIISLSLSI